ncbi:MAG: cell division protein FtsH, partial [Deinococcus sp.]|nr:cell division protein FtsH [Deinococcus sp.]
MAPALAQLFPPLSARRALLTLLLAGPLGASAHAQDKALPPVTGTTNASLNAGGYSTNRFFEDLKAGRVAQVTLDGAGNASVTFISASRPRSVVVPPDAVTLNRIRAAGVPLRVTAGGSPFGWIGQVLPLILTGLILLVLWRSLRGAQGGGNAASQFGKSKAAVIAEGQIKQTFADVAGCDEAKQDLQEVVEFLRHPER